MDEFSVLMPVYWKEDPVRFNTALASIFQNTRTPNEILLICDGPLTLELEKIINLYKDYQGVRIFRLKENQGIVKALNFGLDKVKYDIVVRCDSDDVNHQNRFEKLLAKIEEGFDVVGSQIQEINDTGQIVARKKLPIDHDEIVLYARRRNPLNHMTVAYRASDVLALGGYPNVYLKEDYALWAKLMKSGKKFANLDDSLVFANAGINMYARRGGLKAALSEFELQRILVQSDISSFYVALLTGLMRSAILISPIGIRAFVYRIFLRRKP